MNNPVNSIYGNFIRITDKINAILSLILSLIILVPFIDNFKKYIISMRFITITLVVGSIFVSIPFMFGEFDNQRAKESNTLCRILASLTMSRIFMFHMVFITYFIMTMLFLWKSVVDNHKILFNYIFISIGWIITIVFIIIINVDGSFQSNRYGLCVTGNERIRDAYFSYYGIIIGLIFFFLIFLITKSIYDLNKFNKTLFPEELKMRKEKIMDYFNKFIKYMSFNILIVIIFVVGLTFGGVDDIKKNKVKLVIDSICRFVYSATGWLTLSVFCLNDVFFEYYSEVLCRKKVKTENSFNILEDDAKTIDAKTINEIESLHDIRYSSSAFEDYK